MVISVRVDGLSARSFAFLNARTSAASPVASAGSSDRAAVFADTYVLKSCACCTRTASLREIQSMTDLLPSVVTCSFPRCAPARDPLSRQRPLEVQRHDLVVPESFFGEVRDWLE